MNARARKNENEPATDPKVFSIAFLNAPSESLVDPAGAKFFQKREWLMCPTKTVTKKRSGSGRFQETAERRAKR